MTSQPLEESQNDLGDVAESLVFTTAGSFRIEGSMHETLKRLATEEWPTFTLVESGVPLVIRSAEVAAVQHVKQSRGRLGFGS